MKVAPNDYIINTVSRTNVLPVISKCNTSCIFCSHRQNTPEVEAYRLPELSLDDFRELMDYLSPDRKIIIGDSATRIVEGEPFLHSELIEILELLRKKFRKTTIQITTNGILLDEKLITKMVSLGNIELNISVNCVNIEKRVQLLGRNAGINIGDKLKLAAGKLPISGSCVFVPEIMNEADLEDIVHLLSKCNADMARFFVPGYTDRGRVNSSADTRTEQLYTFLKEQADRLVEKYGIPVLVEPPIITDLKCMVEGVIKSSPAHKAGIRIGDTILSVNEIPVRSRADAFASAYRKADPRLLISRNNSIFEVILHKKRNESPGFIVYFDIEPEIREQISSAAIRLNARSVLVVTSEFALTAMKSLLCDLETVYCEVIAAKNDFFGGTIKCAGLLTIQDAVFAVGEYLETHSAPDVILLPPAMFDFMGRDLLGQTMSNFAEKIKIPVYVPE